MKLTVKPLLLTFQEAAARLGVSYGKLAELINEGEIRSVNIDELQRIEVASLDAYVERTRR